MSQIPLMAGGRRNQQVTVHLLATGCSHDTIGTDVPGDKFKSGMALECTVQLAFGLSYDLDNVTLAFSSENHCLDSGIE